MEPLLMMQAAVWEALGKIQIRTVPLRRPEAHEVVVRVTSAGLCVTDDHVMTGKFTNGGVQPPHILGHEIAGEVYLPGTDCSLYQPGDRVVIETSIGCGHCRACRTGQRHLCPQLTEVGFPPHNGGYAQYVIAPEANLVRIPPAVPNDEAGIMESVVCPVGALYRLGVKMGETVVVIGVGPAGLAFISGARAMGAGKIIALARNDAWLERSKRFGADVVINARTANVREQIMLETDGVGADLVCEAAGSAETVSDSFLYPRRGGRIIFYGLPPDDAQINFPVARTIVDQLSLYGAVGNPDVWEPLLALMASRQIDLSGMITDILPLDRIVEGFERMRDRSRGTLKVVIHPWD